MFSTEDTHIVGKKPSLSVMLSQGISSKVHSLMALVKQVLRDSEQGTSYRVVYGGHGTLFQICTFPLLFRILIG